MPQFLLVVARLSGQALSWAWKQRSTVMKWINNGLSIDRIVSRIKEMF